MEIKKKALTICLLSLFLFSNLAFAGDYIDVFSNDEDIFIWDLAEDRYGQAWINATCNLTVYNQDQTTINISVLMTNKGNGIFNQSIGTFPDIGYYPMELRCYEIESGTGTLLSGLSNKVGFYVTDELTDEENKTLTTIVGILIMLTFTFGYISMHMHKDNMPIKILFLFLCFLFAIASISVSNRYMTEKGYIDISSILTSSYWLVGIVMALTLGLLLLSIFFNLLERTRRAPEDF